MEKMTAKLIDKDYRRRFYELSHCISKGKSDMLGDIDIKESLSYSIDRFKKSNSDGYYNGMLQELEKGIITIVCVSDAKTHVERLVFPAFRFTCEGKEIIEVISGVPDIGGKHTMMINGGDSDSLYSDEVYLRRLCQLNDFEFGGIIDKEP